MTMLRVKNAFISQLIGIKLSVVRENIEKVGLSRTISQVQRQTSVQLVRVGSLFSTKGRNIGFKLFSLAS